MPPRARPGDRAAVEAALGARHLAALEGLCATLGVPRDRWQGVPALQVVFETAAAVRLAAELEGGDVRALERAAGLLGLEPATVLTRVRRFGTVS